MANSSPRLPDNRRVIDAISIGVLTKTYLSAALEDVDYAKLHGSIVDGSMQGKKPYRGSH